MGNVITAAPVRNPCSEIQIAIQTDSLKVMGMGSPSSLIGCLRSRLWGRNATHTARYRWRTVTPVLGNTSGRKRAQEFQKEGVIQNYSHRINYFKYTYNCTIIINTTRSRGGCYYSYNTPPFATRLYAHLFDDVAASVDRVSIFRHLSNRIFPSICTRMSCEFPVESAHFVQPANGSWKPKPAIPLFDSFYTDVYA